MLHRFAGIVRDLDSDDVEGVRFLLSPATSLRRVLAPRVVGAAVIGVVALAVGSWVLGDLTRNYAIGRLHVEVDLVVLGAAASNSQALEWEAIGRRRIDPGLRAEFEASQGEVKAGLQRLRQDANDAGRVRPIEQAYVRYDHALALELGAIQRGQIPLALRLDGQSTDPAGEALTALVKASRLKAHHDSTSAAQLAGLIGWMKMLVAAVATALLVRQAARSRARSAKAEAERESLAELNRKLLEVDRIKDDFIATVSHELRTPLTSIRGYLELIAADAGLSEQGRGFLDVVDRNSERLQCLVADLLFVAQVDADEYVLKIDLFSPQELVDQAVAAARPFAEVQQITLCAVVDDVREVAGDRARLAQLLDNLISNALKFTPPGGRVDVRLSSTDAGSTVLEVADTGIGIPESEQDKTFERFYRATAATKNAIAGTGLGLAIVKLTAEAHGGTVCVESNEGEGSTFRVVLPLQAKLVPAAA
jgi:signal transduction histidine kinase